MLFACSSTAQPLAARSAPAQRREESALGEASAGAAASVGSPRGQEMEWTEPPLDKWLQPLELYRAHDEDLKLARCGEGRVEVLACGEGVQMTHIPYRWLPEAWVATSIDFNHALRPACERVPLPIDH
eukprot:CAMPEP_0113236046 /NCGR_PEP_ID=MMETSP0008_2-20120614/3876_1 /TAXON_ID=97485 /ORGANISM="Prymnesium parvum" /LENGTH=127 /DNA_ID=CAMNT_0000083005 /DNA_START=870 /DNA_END=1254 /DNA_ORIENTATION=- /assembly_acc=CAM_ASM_000153